MLSVAKMWLATKVIGFGDVLQEIETLVPCTSKHVIVAIDCPLQNDAKNNPRTVGKSKKYLFICMKSAKIGLRLHRWPFSNGLKTKYCLHFFEPHGILKSFAQQLLLQKLFL